jgi:hypothetical protein
MEASHTVWIAPRSAQMLDSINQLYLIHLLLFSSSVGAFSLFPSLSALPGSPVVPCVRTLLARLYLWSWWIVSLRRPNTDRLEPRLFALDTTELARGQHQCKQQEQLMNLRMVLNQLLLIRLSRNRFTQRRERGQLAATLPIGIFEPSIRYLDPSLLKDNRRAEIRPTGAMHDCMNEGFGWIKPLGIDCFFRGTAPKSGPLTVENLLDT